MSNWNLTYLEEGKLRWMDAKGRCMILSESGIVNTAQGDPAEFSDGSENYVKSCVCDIVPEQDLNGYDNPWPAGGGKNLLQTTGTDQTKSGVTYTVNSDGTVLVNGTSTQSDQYIVGTVNLVGETAYVLSSGATNNSKFFLQAIGDGISDINTVSGAKTFTPPADMTVTIRIAVSNGETVNNVTIKPMICLSTATDPTTFAPYSNICPISGHTYVTLNVADDDTTPTVSKDYTTTLPQTVYGGSLDMVSGVLTITHGIVDLGMLTWQYFAGSPFKFRSSDNIGALPPAGAGSAPDAISSVYPVMAYSASSTAEKSMTIVFSTSDFAGQVWINDSTYTDAASFKAAMSGVQLVYKLATPQTIQLDPTEILSLYGDNVFSCMDKVTVIYLADTKKYIDNAINSLGG